MFKRLSGIVLVLALAVAGIEFLEYQTAGVVKADSGDLQGNFFGSAATVGVVVTAGTTSQRIIVKYAVITASASVTIVLKDHPASGSDVVITQIGVLANTPFVLNENFWNGSFGYVLRAGSSLQVINENAAAGTDTIAVRYALN